MSMLPSWVIGPLDLLTTLFVFLVGLGVLAVIIMFFLDIAQTHDAIRRNYPVFGRFRYLFSTLGEFFRQYFFAMDREEMPFNRAEREWVHRATRKQENTIAFGSTKRLTHPGTAIFVNSPFPALDNGAVHSKPLIFGPYAREPYSAISFFNISGMSYGALSKPAIKALSRGAKLANCWLNTGEGGVSPYHLQGGADLVAQIGTAKYGVRHKDGTLSDEKLRELAANEQIKMFELKLSQGAKPGKGGMLPGAKVTNEIAEIRGIPVGTDSVSPNRHPEIENAGELLDMINHIRDVSGKPVGFKSVIGSCDWLETVCREIHKRGIESAPDFIAIDGGDGGTGAAPMPLMDNVGLTVKESLPLVVDLLIRYGLRERIHVVTSGKLITPSEVAWAFAAGTDVVTSARGFLFSLGCIQSLKCNKNTCPTGITTHNKRLQRGLDPKDKATKVANYCHNMRHEVEMISHSCGVDEPRQLRRFHVRIVQDNGKSAPMDQLHPYPKPLPKVTDERKPPAKAAH